MKYPLTLTITVKIPNQTNAVDCVADLIDWETELRARNGKSGFIPVTARIKLADSIRKTRRELQRQAGLVARTWKD